MTPSFSCLIATCGDEAWEELAWARAYPSTIGQGFAEVIVQHHTGPDPLNWYVTVAAARNRTLADAVTDYVVFLDADDELEPGYLAAMRRKWGEAPQSYVASLGQDDGKPLPLLAPAVRYVYVRDGVSSWKSPPEIPNRGRWPLVNECVIGTAIPRRPFLELGGFEEWRAWEDWAAFLKLVAVGHQIGYVEDAVYRAHQSGRGRNDLVGDGPRLRDEIVREHRDWAGREGVRPLL